MVGQTSTIRNLIVIRIWSIEIKYFMKTLSWACNRMVITTLTQAASGWFLVLKKSTSKLKYIKRNITLNYIIAKCALNIIVTLKTKGNLWFEIFRSQKNNIILWIFKETMISVPNNPCTVTLPSTMVSVKNCGSNSYF